jgi:hypothetical protein
MQMIVYYPKKGSPMGDKLAARDMKILLVNATDDISHSVSLHVRDKIIPAAYELMRKRPLL